MMKKITFNRIVAALSLAAFLPGAAVFAADAADGAQAAGECARWITTPRACLAEASASLAKSRRAAEEALSWTKASRSAGDEKWISLQLQFADGKKTYYCKASACEDYLKGGPAPRWSLIELYQKSPDGQIVKSSYWNPYVLIKPVKDDRTTSKAVFYAIKKWSYSPQDGYPVVAVGGVKTGASGGSVAKGEKAAPKYRMKHPLSMQFDAKNGKAGNPEPKQETTAEPPAGTPAAGGTGQKPEESVLKNGQGFREYLKTQLPGVDAVRRATIEALVGLKAGNKDCGDLNDKAVQEECAKAFDAEKQKNGNYWQEEAGKALEILGGNKDASAAALNDGLISGLNTDEGRKWIADKIKSALSGPSFDVAKYRDGKGDLLEDYLDCKIRLTAADPKAPLQLPASQKQGLDDKTNKSLGKLKTSVDIAAQAAGSPSSEGTKNAPLIKEELSYKEGAAVLANRDAKCGNDLKGALALLDGASGGDGGGGGGSSGGTGNGLTASPVTPTRMPDPWYTTAWNTVKDYAPSAGIGAGIGMLYPVIFMLTSPWSAPLLLLGAAVGAGIGIAVKYAASSKKDE